MADKWTVVRTIWPYPDGWGVFNETTRTLLDSGLSKQRAESIVASLNFKPPAGAHP